MGVLKSECLGKLSNYTHKKTFNGKNTFFLDSADQVIDNKLISNKSSAAEAN
jgi:hypothetical protein